MFEKVDGTNTYSIQLQLSQGEQPAFENRKGSFGVAASFAFRLFEDRKVIRVPTQEEIDKINILFPDCSIVIKVKEGDKLSDVSQDEQSYRYAIINLGGKDWVDLYTRFEELKQHLRFEFKSMS